MERVQRDVKSVMKYWMMEGEMINLLKLWILVYTSLCYCYFASKLVPKGVLRLISLLPVVCLFFLLPLNLQSIHLSGTIGFFLAWLANFKLLLLAFDHGPLSGPSISLPRFLALACLPINVQKNFTEPRAQSSLNLNFQDNPNPKSLERSDICPQNGSFQEDPHPKSLEKSNLCSRNGNPNEDPYQKSIENGQMKDFQANPHPKSLERSNLYSRNGNFKEDSYPKSTENGQNNYFQEDPYPKSLEKSYLYPKNMNFQEHPHPKSTKDFQEEPHPKSSENGKFASHQQNGHYFQENPLVEIRKNHKKLVTYAIKAILLGLIIGVYNYSRHLHPTIILLIYLIHMYIYLEIIQAIVAAMTRGILGLDLEPQFNDPYFSSSLQDFWGGRWNLMVNRILRPTVYKPVLHVSTKLFGRRFATFPAVVSTFAVSGLMHELLFFYLGRVKPTWEITGFFVLHGTCLAVEIAVKKALKGKFQLPRIPAAILSVGFVMVTGFWLFLPQLLRCQTFAKAFAEYASLRFFLNDVATALTSTFGVFYS